MALGSPCMIVGLRDSATLNFFQSTPNSALRECDYCRGGARIVNRWCARLRISLNFFPPSATACQLAGGTGRERVSVYAHFVLDLRRELGRLGIKVALTGIRRLGPKLLLRAGDVPHP